MNLDDLIEQGAAHKILQQQAAEQQAQHSERGTWAFIQDSKLICEYIKQHGIEAWRKLIG